jgi:hypothetical protein
VSRERRKRRTRERKLAEGVAMLPVGILPWRALAGEGGVRPRAPQDMQPILRQYAWTGTTETGLPLFVPWTTVDTPDRF